MQHLFRRGGRVAPGLAHGGRSAPAPESARQRQSGEIRLHELVPHDRRRPRHVEEARNPERGRSGALTVAGSRCQAAKRTEARPHEALHHQRRVALVERQDRKLPVVEIGFRSRQQRVQVCILVLQRVAQLVGQHDLVHRRQGPLLAHRIEPPPLRPVVVEADDVLLQHACPQRPQVRAFGKQVERQKQSLVHARLRGRVLRVEQLREVRRQLGATDICDRHVLLEWDAAGVLHLLLQRRAVDGSAPHQPAEQRVDDLRGIDLRRFLSGSGGRLRPGRDGGEAEQKQGTEPSHALTSVRRPPRNPRTVYSVSTSARDA